MSDDVFPDGFRGDMKALHKYHRQKLTEALAALEIAKAGVKRWESLEAASGKLSAAAMGQRWAEGKGLDDAAGNGKTK